MSTSECWKPNKSQLDSLQAYVESLENGTEPEVSRLQGDGHPKSIRRTLIALIDSGRYKEASDLIRGRVPHEEWCDYAVYVLARTGSIYEAKAIIEWTRSLDDLTTRRRCVLMFADALYATAMQNYDLNHPVLPGSLSLQERALLRDALDALKPVLMVVSGNERTESELEAKAARIALNANYLLGYQQESVRLAGYLAAYNAGSMELAELALRRLIKAPDDLPQRLRAEYNNSFHALLLAVLVESELLGRYAPAFSAALHLLDKTEVIEQKEQLAELLNELAQNLGDEAISRADQAIASLIADNSRLSRLLQADRLLRKQRLDDAGLMLNEIKDEEDPYWLQIYANYLIQKGERDTAADYLLKASEHLPDPGLLRRAASAAYESRRTSDAIRLLEWLLSLEPGDNAARRNLAYLYTQCADYEKAVIQFQALVESNLEDPWYSVNYAMSLALIGRTQEALQIYDRILKDPDAPLEALTNRAKLLKSIGQPEAAFNSLATRKNLYWDNAEYLSLFLDMSFAAGQESEGHEALLQIQKLQAEGRVEPTILRTGSLDDLVEQIKAAKEHSNLVAKNVLEARLPWILAEEMLGRVPYLGWMYRTQPLRWLWDDPINRAEHSIYSTYGWVSSPVEVFGAYLREIQCSEKSLPIVADLSALITLHRLGLLDHAADYFGKILVPSAYQSYAIEEGSQLVLHQQSEKTSLEAIKKAVDDGNIRILEMFTQSVVQDIPNVSEYDPNHETDASCYGLRDLAHSLNNAGRIDNVLRDKIIKLAHRPVRTDVCVPDLQLTQKLLIDTSTLKVLAQVEALADTLGAFEVYISAEDMEQVKAGLREISVFEEVRTWHNELWDYIRASSSYVLTACPLTSEDESDDSTLNQREGAIAFILSQQEGLPLLVDDRAFQMVAFNETHKKQGESGSGNVSDVVKSSTGNEDVPAAFGTDALLVALGESGLLSTDQVAECLVQLMLWRYRFIVPSSSVMKVLADRYIEHLPGRHLQIVAHYLHDCMRDSSLPGTPVAAGQPVPIAFRQFQTWTSNIADFIMDIWIDNRYAEDQAVGITNWAVQEFLPSPPQTIDVSAQFRIAALQLDMVISRALLKSCQVPDPERANKALLAIAQGLGMEQQDYLKVVTRYIDEVRE